MINSIIELLDTIIDRLEDLIAFVRTVSDFLRDLQGSNPRDSEASEADGGNSPAR